jgi:hypothetical protein
VSDDPRLSDEATGLPPLEEIGTDDIMLVLAWAGGEGLATSPISGKTEACRYLHLRGLAVAADGASAEWAQVHIAVPVSHALDVAATLGKGD